jgi:hypothetical protein
MTGRNIIAQPKSRTATSVVTIGVLACGGAPISLGRVEPP